MKKVAAEAGVNHGLVHYYFGSKERLLVAAYETYREAQRQRIAATDLGDRAALGNLLRAELARSGHLMIEFAALAAKMPQLAETIEQGLDEVVATFTERLALPSSQAASFFIASFFGVAVHARLRPKMDVDAVLDHVLLSIDSPRGD